MLLFPNRHPPRRGKCRGFTLVEAALTLAVLLVGALAVTSTSLVAQSPQQAERERRAAAIALESIVEDVKSSSASSLQAEEGWARAITRSYSAGGLPGGEVELPGWTPREDESAVCTIQVVTDETWSDLDLGVSLGLPRDLNGDGLIASADVSASATLLPVIVRARWRGRGGEGELVRGFYVLGL